MSGPASDNSVFCALHSCRASVVLGRMGGGLCKTSSCYQCRGSVLLGRMIRTIKKVFGISGPDSDGGATAKERVSWLNCCPPKPSSTAVPRNSDFLGANSNRPGILSAVLLILWTCFLQASDTSAIRMVDRAKEAGVDFVLRNHETGQKYQIESMTAGVAILDYDRDGLMDLYFCNGAEIPQLEKNSSDYFNRLYRNLGGFRFQDVTQRSGLRGFGYSMGVAAGDYNNDGWTDLYVTGVNRNTLFRNRGDGSFEDVTEKAGVAAVLPGHGKPWTVGAGWFDYDNDSDLDLFVVNYCVWSPEKDPYCGARKPGYRTYCHPKEYAPLPNLLFRNDGDGSFSDVSLASGVGQHLGKGMGVAFADFDSDGWADVFVSNDTTRNFLFHNRGNGLFEEVALRLGVAYIDEGIAVSGMGADFRDYDGDGLPDILMTALSNETFPVFRNLGNGMFRDERYSSGLGVQSLAWSGWSMGMVDLDNDGWLDLLTAGGHVQTNEELYSSRSSEQANRLFRNTGKGAFQDISAQVGEDFQQAGFHRGAAFGDLDNDGRVDAVITRLNQPVEVFQNQTEPAGHWLILELSGNQANRDGLGTQVRVVLGSGRVLARHATTAVGYGGSSDPRIHFGLGEESTVKTIEVVWPGGTRQMLNEVPVDRILAVHQAEP